MTVTALGLGVESWALVLFGDLEPVISERILPPNLFPRRSEFRHQPLAPVHQRDDAVAAGFVGDHGACPEATTVPASSSMTDHVDLPGY